MGELPKLVEFPDGLGPGVPLFVQCAWHMDQDERPDAAVCDLVMWLGPDRYTSKNKTDALKYHKTAIGYRNQGIGFSTSRDAQVASHMALGWTAPNAGPGPCDAKTWRGHSGRAGRIRPTCASCRPRLGMTGSNYVQEILLQSLVYIMDVMPSYTPTSFLASFVFRN